MAAVKLLRGNEVNDSAPPPQLVSLGGVMLSVGGEPKLSGRRKPLALLVYLARKSPRPSSRKELADLLWGDRSETAARQSLRQCLSELRAALGGDVLEGDVGAVQLPSGAVMLDANQFEADVAAAAWEHAVARWNGEFLPGLDDIGTASWRSWLEDERAVLARQVSIAFAEATAASEARGDVSATIDHATQWCAALPTDERACVRLVTALRTAGRVTDAAARHREFVDTMRRDWQTEPSAKLIRIGQSLERAAEAERQARPRDTRPLTPRDMVGRADALDVLSTSWARAVAGDGQAVVIEGDEGVGKSRLCLEFGRQIEAQGRRACVIEVRAVATERDRPNALLRPILDRLAEAPGLAGASPATLSTLALIAPALAERFRGLPETTSDDLEDAVASALSAVAAEEPVLLVVDDAPEADAPSGNVVGALLRCLPARTLIVVAGRTGAWRSAARRVDAPVADDSVRHIVIGPLTEADVTTMVESMVSLAPEDVRRLGERLYRESGGNPSQIVQLFTHLVECGVVAADDTGRWRLAREPGEDDLALPPAAQDALRLAVERSSNGATTLAYAAAVLGPRASTAAIERVSGLSPAAFRMALGELVVSGILHSGTGAAPGARPGAADWYEFGSEANRRLVYGTIAPGRRRALHAAAARALRGVPAPGCDAAAVAFHEQQAGPPEWWRSRVAIAIGAAAALVGLAAFALWARPTS